MPPLELYDLPSPPLAVDFVGHDEMVALFSSGVEVYSIDKTTCELARLRFVIGQPSLVGMGQHIVVISRYVGSKEQKANSFCAHQCETIRSAAEMLGA